MPHWKRGKISLQNCMKIFFDQDDEDLDLHDALEDVKHLRKICEHVAKEMGFDDYKAYLADLFNLYS